jgi:hypothetical protein
MNSPTLRMHSDRLYLAPNTPHTIMLYPFWGANPIELEANPQAYDAYTEQGTEFLELVSLPEAEVIVAPAAWEKNDAAKESIRRLAAIAQPDKPLIVFFWHDSDEPLHLPNALIFRTSLYKSTQKPYEYAMPAWSEDYIHLHRGGVLNLRPKASLPVVGFCGYALTPLDEALHSMKDVAKLLRYGWHKTLRARQLRAYHVLRGRLIRTLSASSKVGTNFVIHRQFYGTLSKSDRARQRHQFFENIVNSDYVLCVRGAGNFSYRLYETLSCGRIPVLVDTDCVLPYDFFLNWKEFCVWVDCSEAGNIDRIVAAFHQRLTDHEFRDLQRRCRQIWEDYLSPLGFFRNFWRHLNRYSHDNP